MYLPVMLAITTGMRRGAIAAIQWDNVDLKKKMLYVQYSLQRIDGELKPMDTKTNKSRRSVALMDITIEALKEERKNQLERKLAYGEKYQDLNYVCCWDDGRPLDPDFISKKFNKIVKKLDMPQIRFHDLRHTHATMLLKQGTNPKIVQERLGHATISTTMDIYSHALPEMQKEATEKLEKSLFKKALK